MSWLVDLRRYAATDPGRIGPGRLVLVVGPSGAGKDTLIGGARRVCAGDPDVIFPRRTITRPASAAEDNAEVSVPDFNRMLADGAFALWWDAHGHRYGIPSSIDGDIGAGRTVVCNVSRTAIGAARRRYAWAAVVLVTAPPAVLEARLAARGRSSDGSLAGRAARSSALPQDTNADFVIRNVGSAEAGMRRLTNIVRGQDFFIVS